MALVVKNPPAVQETWVQSLVWKDPLEKDMATGEGNPVFLPEDSKARMEKLVGLQSMGSQESDVTQ